MKSLRRRRVQYFNEPTPNETVPQEQQGGGDSQSTFTKEQVDAMLAKDRNVAKERLRQMEAKLAEIEQTKPQGDELLAQLEEARNLLKSREQIAREAEEKLRKQAQSDKERLAAERDHWQRLFQTSTIQREITEAAVAAGAYSPTQIYALLKDTTRLDQTENGFVTTVEITEMIEGKPVPTRLSAADAVKRMLDKPDEFGNLFRSTSNSGLGRNNGPNGRNINPSNITNLSDYQSIRSAVSGRGPKGK